MNGGICKPSSRPADRHSSSADARRLTLSEQIVKALGEGRNKRVRKLLQRLHPARPPPCSSICRPGSASCCGQQIGGSLEQRVLGHLSTELRPTLLRESREDGEHGTGAAPDRHPKPSRPRAGSELQALTQALEDGKLKRVGKLLSACIRPRSPACSRPCRPPSAARPGAWSRPSAPAACSASCTTRSARTLAQELDLEDLIAAVQRLELDDLVDLIQALPAELGRRLVQATAAPAASSSSRCCAYPEESAGGLMNADTIEVRAEVKVGTVLRYLRLLDTLPPRPTC